MSSRQRAIYNYLFNRLPTDSYVWQSTLTKEIKTNKVIPCKGKTPDHTIASDFYHFRNLGPFVGDVNESPNSSILWLKDDGCFKYRKNPSPQASILRVQDYLPSKNRRTVHFQEQPKRTHSEIYPETQASILEAAIIEGPIIKKPRLSTIIGDNRDLNPFAVGATLTLLYSKEQAQDCLSVFKLAEERDAAFLKELVKGLEECLK